MKPSIWPSTALGVVLLAIGAGGGYWLAPAPISNVSTSPSDSPPMASAATPAEPQVLYWFDPMYPQQQFDSPGKSPFMDMQLVPRYADGGGQTASVQIAAGVQQNLGMRLVSVSRGPLQQTLPASGVLAFNDRDVAVLQTRASGFVERTYARAPGDLLAAGAPLADLLVPEWVAGQEELLALRRSNEAQLTAAARQRLQLLGMPRTAIAEVERSGRVQPLFTLRSPIAGVLQQLDVRPGMSLAAGANVAQINGLSQVWLDVAVPEAQAGRLENGQSVEARLPAFAGEVLSGTVASVLPDANAASRSLRVRVELANPDGRLRPGMSAQVWLQQDAQLGVLQIPSEAVIRGGKRNLVMLAEDGGHFRPVEVRLGGEAQGQVEILAGLSEGQQVVASGQFLLDSEASLTGLQATPLPAMSMPASPPPTPTPAPATPMPAEQHQHQHGAIQP
jgi:Cu(I)/Ag(I) efflux system membrane fusion protein